MPGISASPTAPKVAGAGTLLVVAALGLFVLGPFGGGIGSVGVGDATDEAPRYVVANVSGENPVTVAYSTPDGTRQFVVEDVDPALVDARQDWAYLPRSALPDPLERVAGNHTAGVVPAGDWVLVGDLNGALARDGNASARVVAPAGMDVDPSRKAGFLAAFAGPYALAPNATGPVTIIVAPDALPSAGVMYDDRGYVTQHAFWDGKASSVWIHEYVHAKRTFSLAEEMRWFSEASATYFSARMLEAEFEGVSEDDVRDHFAAVPEYEDTPLSSPAAWDDTHADYDRGAKLLYVVDAAIRTGSDGEHTIFDVFRALNRADDPITIEAFVVIVERYSGDEDVDWLRDAITQGGELDPSIEEAGDAFED